MFVNTNLNSQRNSRRLTAISFGTTTLLSMKCLYYFLQSVIDAEVITASTADK